MLFIISFDLYNTLQTGITRAMVLQFIHPSCCETKLFVRKPYTHIHWSQIQNLWRTKLCFHSGSAWWSNEFYRGCLLGQKWLTDSCIPKFTPAWVTGRKSWEPRVYYTFHGQLKRLENVLFKRLWSKLLPGSSDSLVSPGSWSDLRVYFAT